MSQLNYAMIKSYHDKIKDMEYGLLKQPQKNQKKLKELLNKLEEVKDLMTDLMAEELK